MDKRIVFAVAGSGKTTHIVDNLSADKRSLIVTYTHGNCDNLHKKITKKFGGKWPENITLLTYFTFLYRFCYKPFLSDEYKTNGVIYERNSNKFARQTDLSYYMTRNRYLYSNRLGFFMEQSGIVDEIRDRIKKYFDEFVIDEVQDIAGRDFGFLESLMETDVNMLFVGDFYQHTFDTSRDGNVNKTLFDDRAAYETRFTRKGFVSDNTTLTNSWRCSRNVCDYIRQNLGIAISSHRSAEENTLIEYITDAEQIAAILEDKQIIKLHYQNGAKAGLGHKNWGESKGEDHHQDVCVLLNGTTASKRAVGKLNELAASTKNKLYVALTRARGNVFLVDE
ncbi:hypothetical protein [Syntrophomonas curvata]